MSLTLHETLAVEVLEAGLTGELISKDWLACLPVRAKVDEVSTFAAIGAYYEAMGAMGYIDPEPDGRDAVIGEIAVRLGVKPWQMGHFRHRYTNGVEDFDLINLRALTRLGAVKNETDLLAWSLKSDGVGGDPT